MIIWNQQKYVEEILLKNGLSKNRVGKDLFLFSKYYLNKGKSDDEILNILRIEVNKILPDNAIQDIINFTFKKAKDLPSYSLENEVMYITRNEINTILNFTDKIKEQKIIFSMLVIYKFIGYDFYKFIKSDIFKYAKSKRNKDLLNDLIHRMVCKDLASSFYNRKSNEVLIKLNFADTSSTPESEIVITITDFENFICHFENYIGIKTDNCTICNTLIKINSNHQKYCDKCWKEEHKRQDREYQKRKYHSRLLETNPKHT